MAKYSCLNWFITMEHQFHSSMMACVLDDRKTTSVPLPVANGMKQGCALAPLVFSMMFSAMLFDAYQEIVEGIKIRHRSYGKLFNQCHLQAVTKVKGTVIKDFLFAEDCALNTTSEQKMQTCVDRFSGARDNFVFIISAKNTKVLYRSSPGKPH